MLTGALSGKGPKPFRQLQLRSCTGIARRAVDYPAANRPEWLPLGEVKAGALVNLSGISLGT